MNDIQGCFSENLHFLLSQKNLQKYQKKWDFSEIKPDRLSLKNQNLEIYSSSKDSFGATDQTLSSRPRTTEQISSTCKNGAQQLHIVAAQTSPRMPLPDYYLATGGKPSTWFPPGELAELFISLPPDFSDVHFIFQLLQNLQNFKIQLVHISPWNFEIFQNFWKSIFQRF